MSAAAAEGPAGLRQCIMDTETYPNFSMIGLRLREPGCEDRDLVFSTEPGIGGTFEEFRGWYAENGRRYRWIGFNSLAYDNHIVAAVLEGQGDPSVLRALSDSLISNNSFRRNDKASAGGEICVDPFSINGGMRAKIGSLKEIAAKLDAPSLRTLPYEPDRVLTHDEMEVVRQYNSNDLTVTGMVADCQAATIAGRIALAREYKSRSVINAHDARVAERVMALRLFGKDGQPTYLKQKSWRLDARQLAEKTFSFRTPALQEMVGRLPKTVMFEVEKRLSDDGSTLKEISRVEISDSVKVGDVTYNFGGGGLHSVDEPGLFVADDVWTLLDFDVDSFYPALMINHRLVPAHLPADTFLAEFDALRQKRLAAKAAGQTDLAAGLKVAVNSIFGKTKSPYSWLCDPTVLVSTTLLGQLSLLSFVDLLDGVEGVQIISGNTDGLVLKLKRDLVEWVKAKMNRAADEMNLSLSWQEYRRIARKDISNYLAVTPDGKIKAKGSYGYDQQDLGRKAVHRVVVAAVQAFFVNDVPLADTIRGCTDIREFLNYFKATKGYTIVDANGQDLGSIARWYIGTTGVRLLKLKHADGKLTQLVAAGAVVVPDLPETFPEDVDVGHYVKQAEALVQAITEPSHRQPTTIPIAELSQAQRGVLEASKTAPVDLGRCILLDLERYHADWVAVSAGNSHDTMLSLLRRLWVAEAGRLTAGDLLWVAEQLDEGGGVCPEVERRRIVDWIVRHISPFPLPKTVEEHVARAMQWALETVQPVTRKRKQPLAHTGVIGFDFVSDFVKRAALDQHRKRRNVYKLACSICAVSVRNAAGLSEPAICAIIAEIDAFLDAEPVVVGETAEPEGETAPVAPDEPPPTGWRPAAPDEVFPPGCSFRMNQTTGVSEVYEPLGIEAPPDEPVVEGDPPAEEESVQSGTAPPPAVPPAAPSNTAAPQPPHPLLPMPAFMETFMCPNYVVDGIIQRGRLHGLTSATGHGKTAVALFLACLIATGRNLGYIEVTQGAVVFLAGENSDDVCGRCWAACQHYNLDPNQTPIFVVPGNFPLDADAADALKQKINDLGIPIAAIFGDSASAYFPGEDENDNVEMGTFARTARVLTGCNGNPAVIVLCHPTKAASRENLLPRGGGAFLNELDVNLTLWADAQGETTTLHWQGKIRGADFQPVNFGLTPVRLKDKADAKGRPFMSVVATLQTEAEAEAVLQQTTDDGRTVLDHLRRTPGISIANIAKAAGWVSEPTTNKPPVPNKAKVHRLLKEMERFKLVRKGFGGEWAITEAKSKQKVDDTIQPEDLAEICQ